MATKMRYGLRTLVELTMFRYKTFIGPKIKSRELLQQKTEAAVSVRQENHDRSRYAGID
jgi:hypothetical protein